MATLQTSRQSSAFAARTRLKRFNQEPLLVSNDHAEPMHSEKVEESIPANYVPVGENSLTGVFPHHLSELDQHQLLLQTVGVYESWKLVSIQRRPDGDSLVAHLMRSNDQTEPALAIREGRTLMITVDTVGDMKVQYARRYRQGWLTRMFGKLSEVFR